MVKVSVVTVCYNSEKTIEAALQSVVSQTYPNIEYIVIDGMSTDSTMSVVEKYSDKITKIVSEPDRGIYDAMNKGANVATGDYILFLNSDDRLIHENVVSVCVEKIKERPADLVYGDIVTVDKLSGNLKFSRQDKFNKVYVYKNTPFQPATFFSKQVFGVCGGFDTSFKIVSDFDFMLKAILQHKVSVSYIGVPVTAFSLGGVSTTADRQGLHEKERRIVFERYFTPFEVKTYPVLARSFRSLTVIPVMSDILNIVFRFKLDNGVK